MWTIFKKTLKEKWGFMLVLSIVSVLTIWMYVSLFPTISQQSQEFEKVFSQFPKEVWEIFGIQGGKLSMSTLEKFLAVEMFSLMWPLFVIIMSINFGISMIAGEIDKGTIEILLALPVSRVKLWVAKYAGGLLLLILFCGISILSIIPIAVLYKIDYSFQVYLKVWVNGTFFAVAGYSLAMLLSSIFEKGKASVLATGMFLVMYILNILASLEDSLEGLRYLSFFHYLDLSRILIENSIKISSFVVFGTVAVVTTIIALTYFNTRDIST